MGKEAKWQDRARELYREVQSQLLEKWTGPQEGDVRFFKEEVEEALLDLKQAVIDDRKEDAALFSEEVKYNLVELRRASGDL